VTQPPFAFKTSSVIRFAKAALVFSMGLFAFLAGAGNILDPDTNLEFVVHVLSMDTVFSPSHSGWRAITSPMVHQTVFWLIVAMELVVAALCLWGSARLFANLSAPAQRFNAAKGLAVAGLTLGILLWFTGFIAVGGEWFLMWQSQTWNGIEAAFRFSAILFLTLVFTVAEDRD
jgi:predicted small integral membrane protein